MFKYYLYKFGQFCVNRLSLKAAYRISTFISDWHYRLSFRDRRAVKNNLKVIVSNNDNIPFLAREVFRNFGKYLVDFFRMANFLNKDFISRNVKIKNIEYINRVLQHGQGGILLTAHIGNWELGGVIISMLGYPIVAVALPHKERPVNDLFNHQRETKGIKVIPTNGALKRCIETLKDNKLVALLADRDFSLSGEVMDFLGKKAFIPKGPAVFSLKIGSPIIPAFFIREQDDSFTLIFEEPIWPSQENSEEEALRATMEKYAAIIERKIREYPGQWLMFREFWAK